MAADLSRLWKNYLEATTEADLAKPVSYRNSKGEAWSSRPDDILTHVAIIRHTIAARLPRTCEARDLRRPTLTSSIACDKGSLNSTMPDKEKLTPFFIFQLCLVLIVSR